MKYYCIGIKGSGMSALAQMLYDLGNEVIGYDDVLDKKFTQIGLDQRNIKIYNDNNHDIDKDTIVTYSKAFNINHKEIVRVKELGLQIKEYNQIVGEITDKFKSICVSGTHGKTTTSTLISHILNNVYGCNSFIGDGTGHVAKENELLVIESDEFNRHFLAYHPTYTIITNIELEHTEIYKDIDDIINTFDIFANKTKNTIVACGDDSNIRKINFNKPVLFYGIENNNDIVGKNVIYTKEGISFDVYINNNLFGHFNLPLYGKHMMLNALACIGICYLQDIKSEEIEKLFNTFKNAKRRFAETIINKDITIIDDYAHHPTEIKVTLEAVKQKYPDKELVVVFKPNTYSRTEKFTKEFIEALNIADKAYLTEIESDREKQSDYPNIESNLIVKGLKNGEIISEDTVNKLLVHKNAIICFMSCASVEHLKSNYEEMLKKNISI